MTNMRTEQFLSNWPEKGRREGTTYPKQTDRLCAACTTKVLHMLTAL